MSAPVCCATVFLLQSLYPYWNKPVFWTSFAPIYTWLLSKAPPPIGIIFLQCWSRRKGLSMSIDKVLGLKEFGSNEDFQSICLEKQWWHSFWDCWAALLLKHVQILPYCYAALQQIRGGTASNSSLFGASYAERKKRQNLVQHRL